MQQTLYFVSFYMNTVTFFTSRVIQRTFLHYQKVSRHKFAKYEVAQIAQTC